ncbi:MAG: hypothetical protein EPO16_09960 [Dehalococcoidia bacterium]|nr:MAG: hypothetical protein EPO16_09960 [Dehalococcoidia bacterium]
MKMYTKPARALLLGLVASMAALAIACSGSAETAGAGVKASATAATAATATTTSAPVTSTTAPATAPASTGDPEKDLIAKGQIIFQQTAGGVGCQMCHGMEARGDGAAKLGAPNIRGADISRIRAALAGGVPVMGFIKLSEDEIVAVAAFVKSLGGQ